MSERFAVGHVVREWLPRSATFVDTLLRHQREVRPVVLAGRVGEHAGEFPVEELVDLGLGGAPLPLRAARRVRSVLSGSSSSFDDVLARSASARGCRVLHAHFGPVGALCVGSSRRLGIPLVTTFYGYDVGRARRDPAFRARYDELFEHGHAFVCEGPAMAELLAGIGCPAERIHVVRIGLDLALFPFSPPARGMPLVFLQAARMVEKKGFDVTLRAFAAATAWGLEDAELWLLGDGPLRAQLEALSAELRIVERVRFLGSTSFAEYRQALARAHACVQPSRTASDGDTEGGAPTVLLEMQASGIPVLSTRHADIPHVLAHAEALVDEEDADALAAAMLHLAREPDEALAERCAGARAFVEREHDARRTAGQVEALYLDLAGISTT